MIGMTVRYDEVLGPLRAAYDARAAWRNRQSKEPWKLAERQAFRERLALGARLLEIGAGTGQDSAYFQGEGFAVVAADLSPVMVEHCRSKAIEAHVMDFLHLNFPAGSFDAVFAMNCLLHVPNHDLAAVLAAVRAVLRPGGLFFVGVYGGNESAEGPIDDDEHVPPRFFSWRTDEQLLGFAADAQLDVVDFHPVDTGRGYRFQSLTLRRPDSTLRRPDSELALGMAERVVVAVERRSARAILIDDDGCLVLIRRTKPGRAPYWTTAGGGVEEGDASIEAAMRREVFEELGAEAAGASQVFLTSSRAEAGLRIQHFFVTRLVSLDLAARNGPEFSDPSRGAYDPERVSLLGDELARLDLQPPDLKAFILANREALLSEVGLLS